MASKLDVDEIAAKNGTDPVTLTKQEALKQWINMNGDGTVSVRDSLNNSSITDNGAGNYTVTHTNNFSSVNYAPTIATGDTGQRAYPDLVDSGTVTAASYGIVSSTYQAALTDARICTGHGVGDLA